MFNVFAKRKLEKERLQLQQELTKMVTSKDSHWFSHYEIVLGELRGKFPDQIPNVRALCCVVAGGIAGLMALPENIADESKTAGLMQFIAKHSIPDETARWALHCWATALSALTRAQRQALVNEIKALDARARQVEADRKQQQAAIQERARQQAEQEAAKAEVRRMEAVKQRGQRDAEAAKQEAQRRSDAAKQEKIRAESEKKLRAERAAEEKIRVAQAKERSRIAAEEKRVRDNENRHLVQRWRLAFPQQTAAIEQVAELAAQAQERAKLAEANAREKAELDVIDKKNKDKAVELAQDNARIWELQQICDAARKSGDREWLKTYMEIERIKNKGQEPESRPREPLILGWTDTSNYESREEKQKKREIKEKADEDAKRKRIAQEKTTSVNRIAKEKAAQVESLVNAEILRRAKSAPDQTALEAQLAAAWKTELKRREEEKIRSKIDSYREQFPLQVAGFSDEEVLKQINGR